MESVSWIRNWNRNTINLMELVKMKCFTLLLITTFSTFDFSHARGLEAKKASEGECFQPSLAPFINPLWERDTFLAKRTYYIPVASEYSFLNYAEAFLGRPASSWMELEEMCLKVDISGLQARTYGYDRVIDQSCYLTRYILQAFSPGQLKCHVSYASPGTNPSLFAEYFDNVVLTDNRSYVLYVRCVNGIRDYKVISTSPKLPERVMNKVSRKIEELGFDHKLIRTLGCPKRKRENKT